MQNNPKVPVLLETIYSKLRSLTGFTLAEVIVTIIIIAVLASLAYPRFVRSIEITTGREAMIGLELVRAAQSIIVMQTGTVVVCNDLDGNASTDCNVVLNLDLNLNNWRYLSSVWLPFSPFICTAVRRNGNWQSQRIAILADGSFDSTVGPIWEFRDLL